MQLPAHVITKTGPRPGATVAIFCGVHGNERAGILTVNRLTKELEVIAGTVYLVYANPPAIAKNVRLVNANLNRLFLREKSVGGSYEHGRAQELMDLLDTCDALLDLHSYPAPHAPGQAIPFAICEPPSHGIAASFAVTTVVNGFTAAEEGGSDGYMYQNGKPGICVELGANELPGRSVGLGIDTAMQFLSYFGCIERAPSPPRVQRHLTLTTFYKKTHQDFCFLKKFRNLDAVGADEPIAEVNGLVLRAKRDCAIIFPNADRPVGIEAFMLAEERT
jgi:predicted deacylase